MPNLHSFFQNKSIFITGASSGIGEELALQLAQLDARLTITARRRELLDQLAQKITASGKPAPLVVPADVTNDTDLPHAVDEALRVHNRLDIVIANAGFGVVAHFNKLSLDDYRRQFETNVFGLLRTVYATLPAIEKSHGNVVLIGSVAGWAASPGASPYAMSKFAVRALANAITPELALSGVKVTLISPGFEHSPHRQQGRPPRRRRRTDPRLARDAHRQSRSSNPPRHRQGTARSHHHRARQSPRCLAALRSMATPRHWPSHGRHSGRLSH
jgi:short-subunit dehydrogenase